MELPCTIEPDAWFEPGLEADAKSLCLTCPMMEACGKRAIEDGEEYGVWGGLTPIDRALMRWEDLADDERDETETWRYVHLLHDLGMPVGQITKSLRLRGTGRGAWFYLRKSNFNAFAHGRYQKIAEAAREMPRAEVIKKFAIHRRTYERAIEWAREHAPELVAA